MRSFMTIFLIGIYANLNASELQELENKCIGMNARSCTTLGFVYSHGAENVEINFPKAKSMFLLACKYGDNNACNILGFAYLNGSCLSQESNEILKTLNKSKSQGNPMVSSLINNMYESDQCMKKDTQIAIQFYQKACNIGDQTSCKKQTSINKKVRQNKTNNNRNSLDYVRSAEFLAITKRAGKLSRIKSGCKTQAKLACYMENKYKNLCNKVGIDKYYQTCLNLSSFETGTADKEDVVKAFK